MPSASVEEAYTRFVLEKEISLSKDKKCEHQFARIWLASKGYKEGRFCTKCLELISKKPPQELPPEPK